MTSVIRTNPINNISGRKKEFEIKKRIKWLEACDYRNKAINVSFDDMVRLTKSFPGVFLMSKETFLSGWEEMDHDYELTLKNFKEANLDPPKLKVFFVNSTDFNHEIVYGKDGKLIVYPKIYHSGLVKLQGPTYYTQCTYKDCKTETKVDKKLLCCPKCFTEYCSKECSDSDKQNHLTHCKAWKIKGIPKHKEEACGFCEKSKTAQATDEVIEYFKKKFNIRQN
jgi:hypothetical protein